MDGVCSSLLAEVGQHPYTEAVFKIAPRLAEGAEVLLSYGSGRNCGLWMFGFAIVLKQSIGG
jgi:hypothetical protein